MSVAEPPQLIRVGYRARSSGGINTQSRLRFCSDLRCEESSEITFSFCDWKVDLTSLLFINLTAAVSWPLLSGAYVLWCWRWEEYLIIGQFIIDSSSSRIANNFGCTELFSFHFVLLISGGTRADAHRENIPLLLTLLRGRDSTTLVLRSVSKGVLEHLTALRPLNCSDLAWQLIIPSPLAVKAIASSPKPSESHR